MDDHQDQAKFARFHEKLSKMVMNIQELMEGDLHSEEITVATKKLVVEVRRAAQLLEQKKDSRANDELFDELTMKFGAQSDALAASAAAGVQALSSGDGVALETAVGNVGEALMQLLPLAECISLAFGGALDASAEALRKLDSQTMTLRQGVGSPSKKGHGNHQNRRGDKKSRGETRRAKSGSALTNKKSSSGSVATSLVSPRGALKKKHNSSNSSGSIGGGNKGATTAKSPRKGKQRKDKPSPPSASPPLSPKGGARDTPEPPPSKPADLAAAAAAAGPSSASSSSSSHSKSSSDNGVSTSGGGASADGGGDNSSAAAAAAYKNEARAAVHYDDQTTLSVAKRAALWLRDDGAAEAEPHRLLAYALCDYTPSNDNEWLDRVPLRRGFPVIVLRICENNWVRCEVMDEHYNIIVGYCSAYMLDSYRFERDHADSDIRLPSVLDLPADEVEKLRAAAVRQANSTPSDKLGLSAADRKALLDRARGGNGSGGGAAGGGGGDGGDAGKKGGRFKRNRSHTEGMTIQSSSAAGQDDDSRGQQFTLRGKAKNIRNACSIS